MYREIKNTRYTWIASLQAFPVTERKEHDMKVCFFTLGCKVNQHETGALQQLFRQRGYTVCDDRQPADIYIVNSCTVTAVGDKKSLQWLRRAKRQNKDAVTVLTGCFPQAYPEQAAKAPADIIVGNADRTALVDRVEKYIADRQPITDILPHCAGETFENLPVASQLEGHTRAFLKVEDGCNRFCAYCVIPYARGRVRSRTTFHILDEIRQLTALGYREFVLSGINLSCYGEDTGEDLAGMVEAIARLDGVERIRLGSLEPDLITDETWQRLAKIPQLCPQFHLSLQSGCNATLKRMRRRYTAEDYAALLDKLRSWFDRPALTTDVIVGFPGETESDFAESVQFVQQCRFLKVHVFPYSIRPGTAAADFPDQISDSEKADRSHRLSEAAERVRKEVILEQNNTVEEVLLEKPDVEGRFTGYTRRYLPVNVHAPDRKQGEIVQVQLKTDCTRFGEDRWLAQVL